MLASNFPKSQVWFTWTVLALDTSYRVMWNIAVRRLYYLVISPERLSVVTWGFFPLQSPSLRCAVLMWIALYSIYLPPFLEIISFKGKKKQRSTPVCVRSTFLGKSNWECKYSELLKTYYCLIKYFLMAYCMTSCVSHNMCYFIFSPGSDTKYSIVFLKVLLNMHASVCFN